MERSAKQQRMDGSWGMDDARSRLIYSVGVGPLLERALVADLPGAVIRRLAMVGAGADDVEDLVELPRPDLVLVGTGDLVDDAPLAWIWAAWGKGVVIVGVHQRESYVHIWRGSSLSEVVEIGPGFFARWIPTPDRASLPPNVQPASDGL